MIARFRLITNKIFDDGTVAIQTHTYTYIRPLQYLHHGDLFKKSDFRCVGKSPTFKCGLTFQEALPPLISQNILGWRCRLYRIALDLLTKVNAVGVVMHCVVLAACKRDM